MVKYLPNDSWFDEGLKYVSINPQLFALKYQNRLSLKRALVATIGRNQSRSKLEQALPEIRICGFKGPPFLVNKSSSTYLYINTEENGQAYLGELLDLF